jgi:hypothetical protein
VKKIAKLLKAIISYFSLHSSTKRKGGGDHGWVFNHFLLVVFVPFFLPIIQNIISNSSNKTLFFLGVCGDDWCLQQPFILLLVFCIGWHLCIVHQLGGDHGMDFYEIFKKFFFSSLFPFHYPNFDQWG